MTSSEKHPSCCCANRDGSCCHVMAMFELNLFKKHHFLHTRSWPQHTTVIISIIRARRHGPKRFMLEAGPVLSVLSFRGCRFRVQGVQESAVGAWVSLAKSRGQASTCRVATNSLTWHYSYLRRTSHEVPRWERRSPWSTRCFPCLCFQFQWPRYHLHPLNPKPCPFCIICYIINMYIYIYTYIYEIPYTDPWSLLFLRVQGPGLQHHGAAGVWGVGWSV